MHKLLVTAVLIIAVPLTGFSNGMTVASATESLNLPSEITVVTQSTIRKPDQIKVQVILDTTIPEQIDRDYVITVLIHSRYLEDLDFFSADKCWESQPPQCRILFETRSDGFTEPVRNNWFINDLKPTLEPFKDIPNPKDFDPVGEEFIYIQKHSKGLVDSPTKLDCLAPWWIESTYIKRDTWAFVISASCLGLHKLSTKKDMFNQYFLTAFVTWAVVDKNGYNGLRSKEVIDTLWSEGDTFHCISPVTTAGKQIKASSPNNDPEYCSLNPSQWVLDFECSVYPKADIEILRGGKWVKYRAALRGTSVAAANLSSVLNEEQCKGNAEKPFHYVAHAPLGPNYRVKFFGLKNVDNTIVNMKIFRSKATFKNKRYAG
jgi:hypothetical protein